MELAPLHLQQLQEDTCTATLSSQQCSQHCYFIMPYLGTLNIYSNLHGFINTEELNCFCPQKCLSLCRLETTDIADGQGYNTRRNYLLCQGTSELHLTHCLVPRSGHLQLSRKNLRTGSSDTLPEHSASLHQLAGQGLPHTKAMSNFKTALHVFF